MAEAVAAVTKMLLAWPNAKMMVTDGYIGLVAATLCKYPRTVALHCADPITGVALTSEKFIPAIPEIVKWLEREQLPYRNAADRQRRVAEQFAERNAALEQTESPEHRRAVIERIRNEMANANMPFAEDRDRLERPSTWRRFTNEELLAIYGRRPAEDK